MIPRWSLWRHGVGRCLCAGTTASSTSTDRNQFTGGNKGLKTRYSSPSTRPSTIGLRQIFPNRTDPPSPLPPSTPSCSHSLGALCVPGWFTLAPQRKSHFFHYLPKPFACPPQPYPSQASHSSAVTGSQKLSQHPAGWCKPDVVTKSVPTQTDVRPAEVCVCVSCYTSNTCSQQEKQL